MNPIVVGNWKMNLRLGEALILANDIARRVEQIREVNVVLCPPAPYIYPVFENFRARPRNLYLGLQNAMFEESGAYTGETSLQMVKNICRYVICGHSERRKYFGETDEDVNKKVLFALEKGFVPIVCVGEEQKFHLEDYYKREVERMRREGGILHQIDLALKGVKKEDLEKVIIAYEPLWAIGTGNAASGAYAAAVAYIIKSHLGEKFSQSIANEIAVIYGGSATAKEVREYLSQPSLDGLLVGGESLSPKEFCEICKISSEVKSGRAI